MDPFDERILKVLSDGKKRSFHQLLGEVGFSHNTLRLHLESLVDRGLVLKEKMPRRGYGRPMFTYTFIVVFEAPDNPHAVRTIHRICIPSLQQA
jgi:predicted ArsR family transcriptional regulator